MRIDKDTTLRDFIFYSDLLKLSEAEVESLFGKLEEKGQPSSIRKKRVPDSLNDLTFGELSALQSITTIEDMLFVPLNVVMGIERHDVMECSAFDVIRFMMFVKNELVKISKMFERIKYKPNQDEVSAGINRLNFGMFGTADWYARRMGIVDQDYVMGVPWIRIYKCMEMDNSSMMYEKRLRDIISKKK